jgi:hypothetical protein
MRGEKELLEELRAKDAELEAFVAQVLGLGDIGTLDEGQRKQVEAEVEELLNEYDEAMTDGDELLDERFTATALGRLLQQRREISEQIQDLRDDG